MLGRFRRRFGGGLAEENARLRRRLTKTREKIAQLEADPFPPDRIVWIFGAGRTGSTWMASMMKALPGHRLWVEPRVGALFTPDEIARAKNPNRILHEEHRDTWLRNARATVLDGAAARFPRGTGVLVVKEPGGSLGAPVLMEALPESAVVFLIRDPRDVVASWLDAASEGGWAGVSRAEVLDRMDPALRTQRGAADPLAETRRRARVYLLNAWGAARAYDAHEGRKSFVRYEHLRADPVGTLARVYSDLGIAVDRADLERVAGVRSWENVPEEEKGEGKFYRKAKSGGWKEDLTPEQVRIIEETTAPILGEFYPEAR